MPSDYGSGALPVNREFVGYIDNQTNFQLLYNSGPWVRNISIIPGARERCVRMIICSLFVKKQFLEPGAFHVPIVACARGSIGAKQIGAGSLLVSECKPCLTGTYGPHSATSCITCPTGLPEKYYCVFGGANPYKTSSFWFNATSVQQLPGNVTAGKNMDKATQVRCLMFLFICTTIHNLCICVYASNNCRIDSSMS